MNFTNSRRWRLYLIRKSNETRKLFSAKDWAPWKLVTCLECGRRVPPPREWTDGVKPCTALHGTDADKAASRAAEHRARRSGLVELARRDIERYGDHTYRPMMSAAEIAMVEPLVRGWDYTPTPRGAAVLEDLRD